VRPFEEVPVVKLKVGRDASVKVKTREPTAGAVGVLLVDDTPEAAVVDVDGDFDPELEVPATME
jgi:hypothetical protein